MEGRRISASPRSCNGRWVSLLANKKRPRPDAYVNTFNKLLRREISSKPCFSISNAHEKFRNMRLVVGISSLFFLELKCNSLLVKRTGNPKYIPFAYLA